MLCLAPPNRRTTEVVCGLTLRSKGPPTARHQARAVALYILHSPGLASRCRRPLTSNVRPHTECSPTVSPLALSWSEKTGCS